MSEDKGLTAEEAVQAAYSEMRDRFASQETAPISFSRPILTVHESMGAVPYLMEMHYEAISLKFSGSDKDWALSMGCHLCSDPKTRPDPLISLLAIPMKVFEDKNRLDDPQLAQRLEQFLRRMESEPHFFKRFTLINAGEDRLFLPDKGLGEYLADQSLLRNIELYAIKPRKQTMLEAEKKEERIYSQNIVPAMCISIKAALQERFRPWDYGLRGK